MDVELDVARTKVRTMWGCLIGLVILILGPIVFFAVKFHYVTEIKESSLVVSNSPNNMNTVKIVQVGEPFFFGPSSIRLKYNDDYFDTQISNDGKTLDQSNVEINWKNDFEATITLNGEEQVPEVILMNVQNYGATPFKVAYIELGYIPTTPKLEPNGNHIVQIRRSTYSKGANQLYNFDAPVRVYYGQKDSELSQYKEWDIKDFSLGDHFELYWNTDYVLIDVLEENANGTTYVKDSLKIPFDE